MNESHLLRLTLTGLKLLLPKPNAGSLWRDLFYTLLILTLQVAIIPTFFPALTIDLMTSWLAVCVIAMSPPRGLIMAAVGAIGIELHTTVPAGFYVCSYWIMGTLIIAVKPHISWRNILPWMTIFCASQLFMILFENMVYLVKVGNFSYFDLWYFANLVVRIGMGALFGFLLSTQVKLLGAEGDHS